VITEIRDGHVVDRIAREITDAEAHRITIALAAQGIRVEPVVDAHHVLNLWAKTPCTTAQEVVALAAFKAVTDARLAWHGAVAGA
jgi:hypothetical protein